jgi:hypothetical protein
VPRRRRRGVDARPCRGGAALTRIFVSEKRRLALEILWSYVRIRRRLRRSDFQSVVRDLHAAQPGVEPDAIDAGRLGRAVSRTLKVLPTDSRCLMQSLVLTDMLARRGIRSSLVIGVAPTPEFAAHAWVEAAGRPLLPSREPAYERLVEL